MTTLINILETNREKETLEVLRANPDILEIQEGEFVNTDAYSLGSHLSFDGDDGEVELNEAIERDGDNLFPDVPDGEYQVWAYHSIEQKLQADNRIGFTATE